MDIQTCAANNISKLCVRTSNVERQIGKSANFAKTDNVRNSPQNCYNKLSVLCQRIKYLEGQAGIPTVKPPNLIKPLGPNGNAVLSNKVNTLCGRLARVEKALGTTSVRTLSSN